MLPPQPFSQEATSTVAAAVPPSGRALAAGCAAMSDPIRAEIRALELSGIMKIATTALEDPEVIPLWFGESDLVTPDFIRREAIRALEAGHTFYSYPRGIRPLREAIQAYLERLYGIRLDPDRLHVPGSSMLAVTIAGQCLLGAGDEMLLIGPYWPNIRNVVRVCGARVREVRLEEGPERWWLDLERVAAAITPRTKAIYVNSPSNPTGWIAREEELRALVELCRRHGLGLVSDEVYHRHVLDDPGGVAPSVLPLVEEDEPVFVINGFSKPWAMTGWRLGWLVGPRRLVEPLAVLAECDNTGATVFAQWGAIAALGPEGEAFVRRFVARCAQNRDLLMTTLGGHPRIRLLRPEGAFYAFPEVVGIDDSLAFCRRVLAEVKVGIAAGYSFGEGNRRHIRLCTAIAPERFATALARLVAVLDRL